MAQKISYAAFAAMDAISETAEIIDAFFDALPNDVKRRWSKGRKPRGLADNAGQYGIDGADWKLQALYANWHKVDMQQAIKNVIANEIEDQALGALHRQVGKVYKGPGRWSGPAFEKVTEMLQGVTTW